MERNSWQPGEDEEKLENIKEVFKEQGIDLDNSDQQISRVGFHTGYIKDENGEIQYTKPLLNARFKPETENLDKLQEFVDFLKPQTEHDIKVRKRKIGKQALRSMFVFGDVHIGYRRVQEELVSTHDEKAMAVALEIMKDIQPDLIVNLGDFMDFAEFGRYDADSNHFAATTQLSLDRGFKYMSDIRESVPNAKIVELQGNHDYRIKKLLAKVAKDLMGLRVAGTDKEEVFSYEHLMGYDRIDVEYISGYPVGAFEYSDKLQFRHGSELKSGGSTAHKMSQAYPFTSVIQGHGHKAQMHKKTNRDSTVDTYIMNGMLGKTSGEIPGYGTAIDDWGRVAKKQEDWQQGVVVVHDHGNDKFEFNQIDIEDGEAYYQGKRYRAE